jgi:hypothetical protein
MSKLQTRHAFIVEAFESRVLMSAPVTADATSELSTPRYRIAAAAIGQRAFFAGGIDSTVEASNVVDVYDASTGQWSTISAPRPLIGQAFAVDGRLVLTGIDNSGNTPGTKTSHLIETYDPASGTWTVKVGPTGAPVSTTPSGAGNR